MTRRTRTGLRCAATFAALAVLLVAAGLVGWRGNQRSQAVAAELVRLNVVQHEVDLIKYHVADVSGWQAAYALDFPQFGAEALDPGSANRAGYLGAVQKLRAHLAAVHRGALTVDEVQTLEAVDRRWEDYLAMDDRIVAAFSAGDAERADELMIGPSYTAW